MKRAPARQTSKHDEVLIISYQGSELAGLNTTIDLSTANPVDPSGGRLPARAFRVLTSLASVPSKIAPSPLPQTA